MPFFIERNDITKVKCDAIVNAANESLLGGGGVDGAIHAAAGPKLLSECITLGGCKTGEAKITKGYKLPVKYIIHTVGPVWQGGKCNEESLLRSCYCKSMQIAKEYELESIAFPLISAGAYGYPKDEAIRIAKEEILHFLDDNEMTVRLILFDKTPRLFSKTADNELDSFISKNYHCAECLQKPGRIKTSRSTEESAFLFEEEPMCRLSVPQKAEKASSSAKKSAKPAFEVDESYSEMLLRLIDEKGITDAQCYKKSNVSKSNFNKIKNIKGYTAKKNTLLAFAFGLELDMATAKELLGKAGYSLSNSLLFDVICSYYLEKEFYDIHEINAVLFEYDQTLLGNVEK